MHLLPGALDSFHLSEDGSNSKATESLLLKSPCSAKLEFRLLASGAQNGEFRSKVGVDEYADKNHIWKWALDVE